MYIADVICKNDFTLALCRYHLWHEHFVHTCNCESCQGIVGASLFFFSFVSFCLDRGKRRGIVFFFHFSLAYRRSLKFFQLVLLLSVTLGVTLPGAYSPAACSCSYLSIHFHPTANLVSLHLDMNKNGCNNTPLNMHAHAHISTKISGPLFLMFVYSNIFRTHIYLSFYLFDLTELK